MFNNLNKVWIFILFSSIALSSCYKKPAIENSGTVEMSGEWYAQYFLDADPSEPITNYEALLTYNTTDNSTSQIWIDDHTWPFKSKVPINYTALTFTDIPSVENMEDEGTFLHVIEGKVLKNAAKSITGNTVDSIFLRVEFLDDDPGTIYQIRGHMKTGFLEDQP